MRSAFLLLSGFHFTIRQLYCSETFFIKQSRFENVRREPFWSAIPSSSANFGPLFFIQSVCILQFGYHHCLDRFLIFYQDSLCRNIIKPFLTKFIIFCFWSQCKTFQLDTSWLPRAFRIVRCAFTALFRKDFHNSRIK